MEVQPVTVENWGKRTYAYVQVTQDDKDGKELLDTFDKLERIMITIYPHIQGRVPTPEEWRGFLMAGHGCIRFERPYDWLVRRAYDALLSAFWEAWGL